MKTYAAILTDKGIRIKSSSGGVFSALASLYPIVYGIAMTTDCYGAEMVRTEGDISSLRGSKYFQASLGDAFHKVKQDLENGNSVLFSGTGCQINGLKMFLGKDYPNLLTVDVVCHGTPSPKLWNLYAHYMENKTGKKIETVSFRCKDHGWNDFGMKENNVYISKDKDPFMRMFLQDYCLRPSCYQCHAKEMKMSDISIADFWGIGNVALEMHDGMGTSLVITRTEKGQQVFDNIKSMLKYKEVSYEEGVRHNPEEYRSPKRPPERNAFFDDLNQLPFPEMVKKYGAPVKVPFISRIKHKIRKIVLGGGDKIKR